MFRTRLSVLAIAANAAGLLASGYGGSVISPTSDHVTSATRAGGWSATGSRFGDGTAEAKCGWRGCAHPTVFHVEALDRINTDPGLTQIVRRPARPTRV